MKYVRILLTGISGAGASDVAVEFAKQANGVCLDFGKLVQDVASESGTGLTGANILQAPPDMLKVLARFAGDRLQTELGRVATPQLALVDTHLVFLRTTGLCEGMSYDCVSSVKPDAFVTIIDGPSAIRERLRSETRRYFELTIGEIVKWQEFEVYLANLYARMLDRPHIVVPNAEGVEVLTSFFVHERPKVYASYPMTNMPSAAVPRRDEFLKELRQHFTVFNPAAIESSHERKDFYSTEDYQAIENHTIVRDLDWFIKLNDSMVVAYMVPNIFSSGSNDELRFAHEIGRPTYIVLDVSTMDAPTTVRMSPFTTYKAMIFKGPEEFFRFWELPQPSKEVYRLCLRTILLLQHSLMTKPSKKERLDLFNKECKRLIHYHLGTSHLHGLTEAAISQSVNSVFTYWDPYGAQPTFEDATDGGAAKASGQTVKKARGGAHTPLP